MNINATLLGQSIIFIVFVWFCYKFVWPPIVAIMAERKQKIEHGLLAAQKGMAAEQEAQEKATQLIDQSKHQATQIIANAHKQASQTVEDAKSAAVVEADKIMTKAMADIEQERNSTANELKSQLAGLVIKGVNQVLEKEVDEHTHKEMLTKLSTTL